MLFYIEYMSKINTRMIETFPYLFIYSEHSSYSCQMTTDKSDVKLQLLMS